MLRARILQVFFVLVSAFLALPWCLAVPPLTIVIVPLWLHFVRRVCRSRRSAWMPR